MSDRGTSEVAYYQADGIRMAIRLYLFVACKSPRTSSMHLSIHHRVCEEFDHKHITSKSNLEDERSTLCLLVTTQLEMLASFQ